MNKPAGVALERAVVIEPVATLPSVAVPQARLRELDALRAIAVALVFGRHTEYFECGPLTQFWRRCGWVGVDLFFVLSGFLVSGLLFREYQRTGGVDTKRFLVRRGFKIYPSFYLFILASLAAMLPLELGWTGFRPFPIQPSVGSVLSELFFVQNFAPGLWPHTWSLGVEEQFYFMLAFAFWAMTRSGRPNAFRALPVATAVVGVVFLGARIAAGYEPLGAMGFLPKSRADSLLFGALLSYCVHFHRERTAVVVRRWALPLSAACVAAFLLVPIITPRAIQEFGYTALYLGFGAGLMVVLHCRTPLSGRMGAWLAPIGTRSYSIYLWHVPMMFLVSLASALLEKHMGWATPKWLQLDVYVIASVITGTVMASIVEMPALRARERWFPARG